MNEHIQPPIADALSVFNALARAAAGPPYDDSKGSGTKTPEPPPTPQTDDGEGLWWCERSRSVAWSDRHPEYRWQIVTLDIAFCDMFFKAVEARVPENAPIDRDYIRFWIAESLNANGWPMPVPKIADDGSAAAVRTQTTSNDDGSRRQAGDARGMWVKTPPLPPLSERAGLDTPHPATCRKCGNKGYIVTAENRVADCPDCHGNQPPVPTVAPKGRFS